MRFWSLGYLLMIIVPFGGAIAGLQVNPQPAASQQAQPEPTSDEAFNSALIKTVRNVIVHGAPAKELEGTLNRGQSRAQSFIDIHEVERAFKEDDASPDQLKLGLALLTVLRDVPQTEQDHTEKSTDSASFRSPAGLVVSRAGASGDTANTKADAAATPEQKDLLSLGQTLLQLRKDHIALQEGKVFQVAADDTTYAFGREYLGAPKILGGKYTERLLVVFNNASVPRNLTLNVAKTDLAGPQAINAIFGAGPAKINKGNIEVEVAPKTVTIYEVDCGCELK